MRVVKGFWRWMEATRKMSLLVGLARDLTGKKLYSEFFNTSDDSSHFPNYEDPAGRR